MNRVRGVPLRLFNLGAEALRRSPLELGRWIPGLRTAHGAIQRSLYPSGLVQAEVLGHRFAVDADDQGLGPALLFDGVYEAYETKLFGEALQVGDVVLDVGAHIGYYTLLAAREVGRGGHVYSFEPDSATRAVLVRNIHANHYSNVTVVGSAVGAESGTTLLFSDPTYSSCSSINRDNLLAQGTASEVGVISLDEFWKSSLGQRDVALLKIDIQGAEGLLLKGASQLLSHTVRIIFLELWPFGLENLGTDPVELVRGFESYGFRVRWINETEKRLDPADIPELVNACRSWQEGRGHVNLLLERSAERRAT
jgi:FkbM family methyltransferase